MALRIQSIADGRCRGQIELRNSTLSVAIKSMSALRILLVEDEVLLALTFSDVLEDMGHIICAVEHTEAEAISAAKRLKPDLMIVDARLGHGSGISAVEEILKLGYIPHLFISGDSTIVRTRRPDAVTIQKPFRAVDLAHGLRRALTAAAA